VDPLTVLPRELAEQILEYLNFRQLMKTCLVSKEWAQFIRRTPNLWRHLDLTRTSRKVKNTFISRAINTGRSKLKTATLNNLFEFNKALTALVRMCPLEEVNLLNTGLMASELVNILQPVKNLRILRVYKGTLISSRVLAEIVKNASSALETLFWEDVSASPRPQDFNISETDFPHMQNLDLSLPVVWQGPSSLLQSLPRMPNLRTLRLHMISIPGSLVYTYPLIDLSGLTQLSTLDLLIEVLYANRIILPPTIKSLAIGTWRRRHTQFFDDDPMLEPLQWSLPFLEELRICAAEVPFDNLELALRTRGPPDTQRPTLLHTLSMTASDVNSRTARQTLSHPRLAELRHLSLECCHGVDDSYLSAVASSLKKLQSLNVSGTEVTGAGIKQIVDNGLKKLVANNCRFVGLDAIQWARTKGVHVENRNTDTTTGGKKLRY
jgi:F-box/TPR repeat protein Pof3